MKFLISSAQTGEKYTVTEIEAETKEEAKELWLDGEGTVVSESFKHRDSHLIDISEKSNAKYPAKSKGK